MIIDNSSNNHFAYRLDVIWNLDEVPMYLRRP